MTSTDIQTQFHDPECFPLSPMQHYMVSETMRAPRGAGTNVEQIVLRINKSLDMERFKQAWRKVIQHHESLRLGFVTRNSVIVSQYVSELEQINIEIKDWHNLSKPETTERVDIFLQADRKSGFVLTTPPLFRMALLRTGKEEASLVWSFHHAILDKTSAVVVLRDLLTSYKDSHAPLKPTKSFSHYIEALYANHNPSTSNEFWLGYLKDFAHGYALPSVEKPRSVKEDRRQQHGMAMTTTHISKAIPRKQTRSLQEFCCLHSFHMEHLLMGVWAVLLSHYSGTPHVGFGAQHSLRQVRKRHTTDTGMYVNVLPVTFDIDPNTRVSELANHIRNTRIKTAEFSNSSFPETTAMLRQNRDETIHEIFFAYDPVSIDGALEPYKANIACRTISLHERLPGSLFMKVFGKDRVFLELQYDRRRFDANTVQQIIGHFLKFLDAVSPGTDPRIRDVDILSAEEKALIFNRLNTLTPLGRPGSCIHHLIEIQVAANEEAIAVSEHTILDTDHPLKITYGRMNGDANRLANYLADIGVAPKTRVAILLGQTPNHLQNKSPDPVTVILGILKLGAAYLALNPADPDRCIHKIIRNTSPALIITTSSHRERIAKAGIPICCLDKQQARIAGMDNHNPAAITIPEDLACITYMSGQADESPGIMFDHASVVSYTRSASEFFDIRPTDRVLFPGPIGTASSLQFMFPCLFSGARMITLVPGRNQKGENLIQACRDNRITILFLTAFDWDLLMHTQAKDLLSSDIRLIIISGRCSTRERFSQKNGVLPPEVRLIHIRGPAESLGVATWTELSVENTETEDKMRTFHPFANTNLFIANHLAQPALPGTTGSLFVGGPHIAKGYINQPELTAACFHRLSFSTSDTLFFKTRSRAGLYPDTGIFFPTPTDEAACKTQLSSRTADSKKQAAPLPGIRAEQMPIILVGNSVGSARKYAKTDLGGHPFFHAPIFIHFYTMANTQRLGLDIPELAAKCLKSVKQAHPKGPYIIIGECQNATVAHEMVCQLSDKHSGEVALLIIIDENWGGAAGQTANSGKGVSAFLKRQTMELHTHGPGVIFGKVKSRTKQWIIGVKNAMDTIREKISVALNKPVPVDIQFRSMERVFYKACNTRLFRPRPYNGQVLLLYSRDWIKKHAPKLNRYYTGKVHVRHVDIDHDEWFAHQQLDMIMNQINTLIPPRSRKVSDNV